MSSTPPKSHRAHGAPRPSKGRPRWLVLVLALVGSGALALFTVRCISHRFGNHAISDTLDPIQEATPERAPAPSTRAGARACVGINLAPNDRSARSYPFVDLMKSADAFFSGTADRWEDGRPLERDAQGWVRRLAPGQIARALLISGEDPHHPSGEFLVRYKGRGHFEFRGGAHAATSTEPAETGGEFRVQVSPPDGLWIEIDAIDPSDPLREIEVILPGGSCEEDAGAPCERAGDCEGACLANGAADRPISAAYLAELRPFGIARFMDWQQTNGVRGGELPRAWPLEEPSDLPTRDSARWHPVPLSILAEVSNLLDADAWISVPHAASDALVRTMAEELHATLNDNLKLYVEYSNEVWNDLFVQNQAVAAIGCTRYSPDPARECRVPGEEVLCAYAPWDPIQARCAEYRARYFATRTAEIGAIFAEVFEPERLIRVLATQIGSLPHGGIAMLRQHWRGEEPVSEAVDAVAIAPYFGHEMTDISSIDDAFVISDTQRYGAPPGTYHLISGDDPEHGGPYRWIHEDLRALREDPALAHLPLLAYEAGQHLMTLRNPSKQPLLFAINRDPRMGQVYAQLQALWDELTGHAPIVYYNSPNAWSQWGAWGAAEYQGQPREEAPKWDAILRAAERSVETAR